MAFPTALTAAESFGKVQATARRMQTAIQQLHDQSAAGNTAVVTYVQMINNIHGAVTLWDSLAATPGLVQYARDQYNDQTLDIVAEFQAMRAAVIGLRNWIFANIPKDANDVPLLQTLNADGTLSDRTVTPAQTAGFRTQAQAVLATMG